MRRLGAIRSPSFVRTVAPASIAQVYEAHFAYVWRCLRSLGVRDDQLDDAVQDVFMVVHRKLDEFDGQVRLTTWLYEIALRVARRYVSRNARDAQRQVASDPDEGPISDDPRRAEDDMERNQRLGLARRALDALPSRKREIFVLACIEQRSAPEIAKLAGIPANTVYSRIRAAKRAFATELERLRTDRTRSSR